MIPELEYSIEGNTLKFRYADIVEGFDMPIQIHVNEQKEWIYPSAEWKTKSFDATITDFNINRNFYIEFEEIN